MAESHRLSMRGGNAAPDKVQMIQYGTLRGGRDLPEEEMKKRKRVASSEHDLRKDLDERLEWRIGYPKYLPVLPVEEAGLTGAMAAAFAKLQISKYQQILHEKRVEYELIEKRLRYTMGQEPTSDDVTLFIVAKRPARGFQSIVIAIVEQLRENDIYPRVEMIDSFGKDTWALLLTSNTVTNRSAGLNLVHIPMTDRRMIDTWNNNFKPKVLDILSKRSWVSINLWMRQTQENMTPLPTVIVCSPSVNDDIWWDEVKDDLEKACNLSSDARFMVEFFHEVSLDFTSTGDITEAGRKIPPEAYDGDVPIGASFSPTLAAPGKESSGTAGALVRLRENKAEGEEFDTILSNYHVIWTADLEALNPDHKPIAPDNINVVNKAWQVASPSQQDHDLRMETLRDVIRDWETDVQNAENKIAEIRNRGQVPKPKLLSSVADMRRMIQERRDEMQACIGKDRSLGYVFAASGFQTFTDSSQRRWAIDWSLSRLDNPNGRTFTNNTPSNPFIGPHEYVRTPGELDTWNGPGSIAMGQIVAKRGRTTGWTIGEMTQPESILYKGHPYGHGVCTYVNCVIGRSDQPFSERGDSGAVVFNADRKSKKWGQVVGLLNSKGQQMTYAYFIPMNIVIDDIERVTKCTVVEPARAVDYQA